STLKKSLEGGDNYYRKLHASNYHLLEKYKHNKNSRFLCLKNEIRINGVPEKKDISHNENDDYEKKKQSKKYASNIAGHKSGMKNKSSIFKTKKYSHFEKKIFKELDYTSFLQNNRTIIEISLGFAGKGSLLYHLGLDKKYLKSLTENNGPWSPIVRVLENLGDILKHSASGRGEVVCGWCYAAGSVSDMLLLLYQEFFITIKKLKNMKKLNSKKGKLHTKKYLFFYKNILNIN
ncbi:hypothetical protein PMALA_064640, partial [Plasmodium malariae]